MTCTANRFLRVVLASVAGIVCLFGSEAPSPTDPGSWMAKAQAVLGAPATPMSYAGVARRTTRGVAPGVGAPGVGVGSPGAGVSGVGNRGGPVNRAGRR
jgi:hypothetical protein